MNFRSAKTTQRRGLKIDWSILMLIRLHIKISEIVLSLLGLDALLRQRLDETLWSNWGRVQHCWLVHYTLIKFIWRFSSSFIADWWHTILTLVERLIVKLLTQINRSVESLRLHATFPLNLHFWKTFDFLWFHIYYLLFKISEINKPKIWCITKCELLISLMYLFIWIIMKFW